MAQQWAGTTYGNGWMHKHLIRVLRFIPVGVMYVFAAVFIVPVCIAVCNSRRTSYSFYRKRMGYGSLKSAWSVYANHCMFARTVIDKFAMYAGRRFDVQVEGLDEFNARASREEGFIHMSSQLINFIPSCTV